MDRQSTIYKTFSISAQQQTKDRRSCLPWKWRKTKLSGVIFGYIPFQRGV